MRLRSHSQPIHRSHHVLSEDESDENGSSSSSGSNGSAGEYEFQARRTLYLMTGGNIPISSTLFELMPSAMMATDFRFTRLSLTARLRWKKDGIAGSRISSRRCAERQPVGRIPRVLSRICLRLSHKQDIRGKLRKPRDIRRLCDET